MKAKSYILLNDHIVNNLILDIRSRQLDGKTKVNISAAANKSARQRGLQHIWYEDVVKSGVGGIDEESHKSVSIKAKRDFAMHIIFMNPEKYEDFLYLYNELSRSNGWDRAGFISYFYDKHLHTEWFDTQEMAKFLTYFQVHYSDLGVNLSDPIDHKLLKWNNGGK